MLKLMRFLPGVLLALLISFPAAHSQSLSGDGWPTYGGDPGGQRYSKARQITPANVAGLHPLWTYHTGAIHSSNHFTKLADFEATPVLLDRTLYLTTPFDKLIALDAATGAERWTYDPKIPDNILAGNYTSRGVALWKGPASVVKAACANRIILVTLDARLIAVDPVSGTPCAGFGDKGQVDLRKNVPTRHDFPYRFFGNTSPATIVDDVIILGAAVGDNQVVDAEPGYVRGFDVRTGALLWTWDALPWAASQNPRTGAGNTWGVIAADPEHHLVFLPTGSPSLDFYGGLRPGDNRDANSLVALDARTGKKIWSFQLVHHDIWDYDVAGEPLLFTFRNKIPAVAVAAKVGMIFVFNRLTGEPLYPIEERPVPKSDIPGELASPTQPFSSLPPLNPQTFDPAQLAGHTSAEVDVCEQKLRPLRYEGIYTPPSLRGTLQFPGSLGGVNWSSMALDPETAILYANTNRSAYEIRLVPRSNRPNRLIRILRHRSVWIALASLSLLAALLLFRRRTLSLSALVGAVLLSCIAFLIDRPDQPRPNRHRMINSPDSIGELSPNIGAPYSIFRKVLSDGNDRPCTPTPWGATTAINLNTGQKLWERPLGTMIEDQHTGTVNFGAPVLTAGGLLFTAASQQPLLRALDKATGQELWTGRLPVPAQSTPMTYTVDGKQIVVVDAGGHGGLGTPLGDSVVAFALP